MLTGCASVQMPSNQIESVRGAADKILPPEAKVEVSTKARLLSKPILVISTHLLEGYSADGTSPYARGDYATYEKLTRNEPRLVKYERRTDYDAVES